PATCEARPARSTACTASSCFPMPMRISSARGRSISTASDSRRKSSGAPTPRPPAPSTWISGRITSMPPDPSLDALPLADSLRDGRELAFAEPWQARAFAIAVLASRQGCFTWSEWTNALGRELQSVSGADPQVAAGRYFDCWLSALQSLLIGKGALAQAELHERKDAWEDAYRRTPHGMPVSLAAR